LIERELEQMTEQIKSVIQSLNSNQVLVVVALSFHKRARNFAYNGVLFRVENLIPLME